MPIFIAPFLLIRRSGETIEFDSLDALAAAVRASRITVEHYHVREITHRNGTTEPVFGEWIVRDDHGAIVLPEDWGQGFRFRRRLWWNTKRDDLICHAERLGLPIPFAGRRTFGYANVLRQPRHHGVWRAEAATAHAEDDLREFGPIRGRIKLPPTNYDDIRRDDYGHRSWKRHRDHQHR